MGRPGTRSHTHRPQVFTHALTRIAPIAYTCVLIPARTRHTHTFMMKRMLCCSNRRRMPAQTSTPRAWSLKHRTLACSASADPYAEKSTRNAAPRSRTLRSASGCTARWRCSADAQHWARCIQCCSSTSVLRRHKRSVRPTAPCSAPHMTVALTRGRAHHYCLDARCHALHTANGRDNVGMGALF